MITIIMPVSRKDFLKRVFNQLELMDCDRQNTNLLVYVDGGMDVYLEARKYVTNSKFNERLCIYRNKGIGSVSSVHRRRQRISDIHNEIKTLIKETDYILMTEDDTLMPLNTIPKMLHIARDKKYFGFITGVQLGRWGYTHIGAWKFDDVYEPTKIESVLMEKGLKEIDAAGIYCCFTTKENYIKNNFKPYDEILGPDVQFGIYLRQQGLKNYIDYSITCDHLSLQGNVNVSNSNIVKVSFIKDNNENFGWRQEVKEND